MNVLITGGTGFIGSRLALRSTARGHSVVVLGQVNTEAEKFNRRKLEEAHVGLVMGSVSEPDKIRMAMQERDVVFHLAAKMESAMSHPLVQSDREPDSPSDAFEPAR